MPASRRYRPGPDPNIMAGLAGQHRARVAATLEGSVQKSVADALTLAMPADAFWTAIPGGDGRATRTPGYRSGTPDLYFLYRGRSLFIELKRPGGGVLSAAQLDVHPMIEGAGGEVHVARTLGEVVDLIKDVLQCPLRLRLS